MKPVTILVIKYSGVLLVWLLILYWVLFLSPFNIPEFIPRTPIKVYGLLLTGFILTILIFSQKELLRKNNAFSVGTLTLIGTTIVFTNEIFFLLIIAFPLTDDWLFYYIKGIIATTLFGAFLSFLWHFN